MQVINAGATTVHHQWHALCYNANIQSTRYWYWQSYLYIRIQTYDNQCWYSEHHIIRHVGIESISFYYEKLLTQQNQKITSQIETHRLVGQKTVGSRKKYTLIIIMYANQRGI